LQKFSSDLYNSCFPISKAGYTGSNQFAESPWSCSLFTAFISDRHCTAKSQITIIRKN